MWDRVIQILKNDGFYGNAFQLKCANHPNVITEIRSASVCCSLRSITNFFSLTFRISRVLLMAVVLAVATSNCLVATFVLVFVILTIESMKWGSAITIALECARGNCILVSRDASKNANVTYVDSFDSMLCICQFSILLYSVFTGNWINFLGIDCAKTSMWPHC
jgi:hypothetical protein